jgi:hypothetical protein
MTDKFLNTDSNKTKALAPCESPGINNSEQLLKFAEDICQREQLVPNSDKILIAPETSSLTSLKTGKPLFKLKNRENNHRDSAMAEVKAFKKPSSPGKETE